MAEPSAELLQMMENPTSTTPMPAKNEAEPVDTSMSADETPPMASPMSTPEPKTGSREAALINIGMAMDLIEQSIAAIGSDSAEGQKVLSALKSLTAVIGERKAALRWSLPSLSTAATRWAVCGAF
jgi:hypothetical protein